MKTHPIGKFGIPKFSRGSTARHIRSVFKMLHKRSTGLKGTGIKRASQASIKSAFTSFLNRKS